MKKRIIACILSALCFFAVGCRGNSGDNGTGEEREKYRYTEGVHQLTATETTDYMVQNGKSEYKILLPNQADGNLFVAESELKYFFEEATGVKLTTVTEPEDGYSHSAGGQYISIGQTKMLESADIDVDKEVLGSQGFRIVTKDKSVYLIGATTVGTLNSVYTMLELLFEYEQYAYDCFTIKKTKNAKLLAFDVTDVPDIEMRSSTTTLLDLNPNNLQYRFRVSSNAAYFLPLGDLESGATQHVYHNTINVIPRDSEYARETWFSNQSGEGEGNTQLCYTARGIQEDYDALIDRIAYVISRSLIMYPPDKFPLRNIAAFTHEDNELVMCRCETCLAAEEKYGTQSGAAIVLSNDVAAKLEEWMNQPENAAYKRDDLKVVFFAYNAFLPAPAHYDEQLGKYVINHPDLQMRDDVGVFYAISNGLGYQENIYSDRSKEGIETSLKWFDIAPSVYLWTYNANFGNFMFRTAGTNFYDTDAYQFFATGGAKLLFVQGATPTDNVTSFQMLDAYLDAKMQWDTTQDINELTQRWFKGMFKEAADVMFDLYVQENIAALVIANETKKIAQTGIINYSIAREYFGYEMLNGWLSKIETARALTEKYKTSDPEVYAMLKEHIDIEWVCPAYYMLTCNADSLSDARYNDLVNYFKTNISALRDFRISERATTTVGTWSAGLTLR